MILLWLLVAQVVVNKFLVSFFLLFCYVWRRMRGFVPTILLRVHLICWGGSSCTNLPCRDIFEMKMQWINQDPVDGCTHTTLLWVFKAVFLCVLQVWCCDQLGSEAPATVSVCDVWADPPARSFRSHHAGAFPEAEFNPACPATVPGHLCSETQVPGEGQYMNSPHRVNCERLLSVTLHV